MMAKKKASKPLRPDIPDPAAEKLRESLEQSRLEGPLRPMDDGGEEVLAGLGVQELAGGYVDLLNEEERLEKELKDVKKKLDLREGMLIEEFHAGRIQKISIKGKTLYEISDWIINRATDVTVDILAQRLKAVRLSELINLAVNANTLKATVKKMMENAQVAERHSTEENPDQGKASYCPKCCAFFDVSQAATPCPECSRPQEALGELGEVGVAIPYLIEVFDGVPVVLREVLFMDRKFKIGARSC